MISGLLLTFFLCLADMSGDSAENEYSFCLLFIKICKDYVCTYIYEKKGKIRCVKVFLFSKELFILQISVGKYCFHSDICIFYNRT